MKKDEYKRDPDRALRISKLEIDADKDWEGKGITNLKGITPAMDIGDVVYRGTTVLRQLQPGWIGYALVSQGPGHAPKWAPLSSSSEKWISAWLDLELFDYTGVFTPSATLNIGVVPFTDSVECGNYIETSDTLNLTLFDAGAAYVPDHEPVGINPIVATMTVGLGIVVA